MALEDGRELRLLSAFEVMEARREAEGLAAGARERALCSNACLLARALEKRGRPVYESGEAALKAMTALEIEALAKRWAQLNREENPSPEDGEERVEEVKAALEGEPYERLQWRVLKAFGALPTEGRARAMTHRDFLWCALNLLLDEEEALEALCPQCRAEAERGICPACGRETGGLAAGENGGFDLERYERLKRGEED